MLTFQRNTGNLGIGTTTPGAKLDVTGSGTGNVLLGELGGVPPYGAIGLANSLAPGSYNFTSSADDANLYINRPAGKDMKFRENNGADQMTILSGGNIGIGTISPTQKLDVNGTVKATTFDGSGASLTNLPATALAGGIVVQDNATSPNIIGGYSGNSITGGVVGGTISGGGETSNTNRGTDDYGTVGGGKNNQAGDNAGTTSDRSYATVAGGVNNTASGDAATVGGGYANTANGLRATVGGGNSNIASGGTATVGGGNDNEASNSSATVSGGSNNTASGQYATVPGGILNQAMGAYSFAAGRRAHAHEDGTFVWADSTDAEFMSTGTNQFLIRASGGVGIGTASPGTALDVAGSIRSTSGGFIFPDATTLASATAARVRGLTYLAGCDTCSLLTDADDQRTIYVNVIGPMTINSVTCFSDAGTPTINLQRDDGSVTDMLSAPLTCNGTPSSAFVDTENLLSLDHKLDFVMVAAGGTAKRVTVIIKATVN